MLSLSLLLASVLCRPGCGKSPFMELIGAFKRNGDILWLYTIVVGLGRILGKIAGGLRWGNRHGTFSNSGIWGKADAPGL